MIFDKYSPARKYTIQLIWAVLVFILSVSSLNKWQLTSIQESKMFSATRLFLPGIPKSHLVTWDAARIPNSQTRDHISITKTQTKRLAAYLHSLLEEELNQEIPLSALPTTSNIDHQMAVIFSTESLGLIPII